MKINSTWSVVKNTQQIRYAPIKNHLKRGICSENLISAFVFTILFSILFCFQSLSQNGRLVLKFENEKYIPVIEKVINNDAIILKSAHSGLNQTFSKYKIKGFQRLYPSSKRAELLKYYKIEVDFYEEFKRELQSKHKDKFSEIISCTDPTPLYIPNDYDITMMSGTDGLRAINLSYLEYINIPSAWDITKGDSNIVVGIIDNYLNPDHEDLIGKIFKIYDSNIRSEFAGKIDHGTKVAGVIAAKTNNNKGISSVGYNCKLAKTSGNLDDLLKMAKDGIKVINISQDWGNYRADYQELIYELTEDYGVTVVAAAGNNDDTAYIYPASYNNVISVTSVGHEFERGVSFNGKEINWKDCHRKYINMTGFGTCHQHNNKVDICAPGYYLITLCQHNSYFDGLGNPKNQLYCVVDGTSFASAIVAGLCALMYSVNPELKPEEVEEILKLTAVNIDTIPENKPYKGLLGAGRIDAYKAVKMAECWPDCLTNSVITQINVDLTKEFKVFPNPTTDFITIDFSTSEKRIINILSQNGSLMYNSTIKNPLLQIDLTSFKSGIYIIAIQSNNQIAFSKILKL